MASRLIACQHCGQRNILRRTRGEIIKLVQEAHGELTAGVVPSHAATDPTDDYDHAVLLHRRLMAVGTLEHILREELRVVCMRCAPLEAHRAFAPLARQLPPGVVRKL